MTKRADALEIFDAAFRNAMAERTMTDIVARMRLLQKHLQDNDAGEAADAIEALRDYNTRLQEAQKKLEEQFHKVACEEADAQKEIARLREALKPFAEAADIYNLNDFSPSIDEEYTSFQIGLCRAAQAAMGESDEVSG